MKELPKIGDKVFFITAGYSVNHLPKERRSYYGISIPSINLLGLFLFEGKVEFIDTINHFLYVIDDRQTLVHKVPQERAFYTKEEAIEDVKKEYAFFNKIATEAIENLEETK